MAWRFKQQSKYKNSAPKSVKKDEWMTDLPVGALMQTHSNHIKASCHYIAFNTNHTAGSSLGILPLNCSGRQTDNIQLISAHTDLVTDFEFSPFNDCLLASCSQDCSIRLWVLPDDGLTETLCNPTVSLPLQNRRIETLLWHPTAEGIISASIDNIVKIFDVNSSQEIFVSPAHGELIQGMSWRGDGTRLVTCCKDTLLRLWDPRSNACTQANGHEGVRDSRVVWVGDQERILSTGFDDMRQRKVGLWDVRNMASPLHNAVIDRSTGSLMPFLDVDTNMLILVGKGDSTIQFWEVTDKDPYLSFCANDRIDQVKGVASVPKPVLDVMKGEVMRLLLLTKNHIIPVPYIVPRKSYSDFHPDIFPDTSSMEPSMTAQEWLQGGNKAIKKMSLNPRTAPPIPLNRGSLYKSGSVKYVAKPDSSMAAPTSSAVDSGKSPSATPTQQPVKAFQGAKPSAVGDMVNGTPKIHAPNTHTPSVLPTSQPAEVYKYTKEPERIVERPSEATPVKRDNVKTSTPATTKKSLLGARKSKFRYLKGTSLHKDTHYTNLRKVGKTVPGECDMFHANPVFCALPLDGPGGLVAIIKISRPGKLPDFGIPAVQNGAKVMDFAWDPFNNHRLVVACDDATVRVWHLAEDGPTETETQPHALLRGHNDRICCLKFHPLAASVLATASHDHTVKIWDLDTMTVHIELQGHTENILCFGWSQDGDRCATITKGGKIRIYQPRMSPSPIQEGVGPCGPRGARLVWVLDDRFIFITGFTRTADREISIHSAADVSAPLQTIIIDTSPAILVPFYDDDSSVILMTGRGDGTVFAYEVSPDEPHLFDLCNYRGDGMHQALAYLPKNQCDVAKVEFAFAYRLKLNLIEPISFTVPRVKMELFQDDIFPDTKVTWQPTMTSDEWFGGTNRTPRRVSLQPANMKSLSESTGSVKETPRKYASYNPQTYKSDEQKKEELLSAMNAKLSAHGDQPLPQDSMEGVESSEWDD